MGFGVPGDSEGLIGRTVVAAMVGGLSSKMTGGTFTNGAMTAAFVHLFNAEGMLTQEELEQYHTHLETVVPELYLIGGIAVEKGGWAIFERFFATRMCFISGTLMDSNRLKRFK